MSKTDWVPKWIVEKYATAIQTPHEHETGVGVGQHPALWVIWRVPQGRDIIYPPMLDCVCTDEDLAWSHVIMAIEGSQGAEVFVERFPANHRFASSLSDQLETFTMKSARSIADRYRKHKGD